MAPWSRREPSDASTQLSLAPGLTPRLAEHDPCLPLQLLAVSVVSSLVTRASVQPALELHIIIKCVQTSPDYSQLYTLTSLHIETSILINLKSWSSPKTHHTECCFLPSPLVFTLATYNCWSMTNGKGCRLWLCALQMNHYTLNQGQRKLITLTGLVPEIANGASIL